MYTAKQQKPQQSRVISHLTDKYVQQLQPWTRGSLNGHNTDVDWTTSSIIGTTVGVKMNAILGPEHLQGGPPKTNVQKDLMNKLPTTPTLPNPSKYIKGHLLNDNVGGPGEEYNLFPITAAANKEHERNIEHNVKEWVNMGKHWVKYNVEVTDINNQITNSQQTTNNFINCKFRCHANVMATDLNGRLYDSDRSVDATITSEYKADSAVERKENLGNFPYITDSNRLNYIPLWSKTKQLPIFDTETMESLAYLFRVNSDKTRQLLLSYKGIGKGTIDALENILEEDYIDYNSFNRTEKMAYTRIINQESLLADIAKLYIDLIEE